jgi:hypothetical protein
LVLPVRILPAGKGAVAIVGVCIDGAGPFPFLVDSGSSVSAVDTQLSRRFHLRQVAAAERAAGVGCSAMVVPERLSSWSAGGLPLLQQVVLRAPLPDLAAHESLAGIIGSDVLSRFGAVLIDYRAQTMSLGGPESASPTANGIVRGPTSKSTPAELLTRVRVHAALTVVTRDGAVGVYAPIRFGGSAPHLFAVDTGAEISAVSPGLARSLHLVAAHRSVSLPAFGCPVTLSEVQSGRWLLGSSPLVPQPIARLPATGLNVDGLLGSNVLSYYGAAVIDYRSGQLLLESR